MTLNQFARLSEEGQLDALMCQGTIIGRRDIRQYQITLFQIGSFYVEVYHNLIVGGITRLRSFEGTAELDPYLAGIDLSALIAAE
ncbi:MAG TPA: hypothetical protein VHK69_22515 [Chitinophagaceae bacterium]|jgi:hypothetical protein|nr:hypothetical protein [Chitinophagaceae bacterium]